MARSESTVARFDLAKRNEEQVMAENALRGERIVAVVRLVMVLGVTLTTTIAQQTGAIPFVPDPARGLVSLAYLLFAGGAIWGTFRNGPSVKRAQGLPYLVTLIDVGFVGFMAIRQWQLEHTAFRDVGVAFFALFSCFAIARFSLLQVIFNSAVVCLAALGLELYIDDGQPFAVTLWVVLLLATLGLIIGLTRARTHRMFLELRRRDSLTRFLPAQVAERVMELGGTALQPTQREVTVMFSDIRDFTRLSEALPPQAVLALLDDYFSRMGQVVKAHQGIVNKFLGDGLLAVWGVPERLENHPEHALRCALDMRKVLTELNQDRARLGAEPLRIGIGIHSGPVAAGMLGGADQHEYTVIGDAVNLTSRIEGLTKTHGVDVLVSEATWEQVSGRFSGHKVADCQVKGRAEPVTVYALGEEKLPGAA